MAVADHLVDMGPKTGTHGGQIVFEGTYDALTRADTLTARFLTQHRPIKRDVRKPTGTIAIKNAKLHGLKNVSVGIPTGVLTIVTGVAGSGNSTLINDVFLEQHPDAVVVEHRLDAIRQAD